MSLSISVSPQRIARVFLACVVLITIASVAANALNILTGQPVETDEAVRIFNLGSEKNIPTWFASVSMFSASLLLIIVNIIKYRSKDKFRHYWLLLFILSIFISMDSVATIHDGTLERFLLANFEADGFFHFPWVIPAWIFVILMAIIYRPFLLSLPDPSRKFFIASGAVYITGALIFEMVSAFLMQYHVDAILLRGAIATLQEFLELLGIVLFIYALLIYISAHVEAVHLEITQDRHGG